MRAAVLSSPGGPNAFELKNIPVPSPPPDHVLLHIIARGINRSELFTRQGHSPGVKFPRVLGIEAVGNVVAIGSGDCDYLIPGYIVATCMGGIGRDFDGSYAEYCVVPAANCVPIDNRRIQSLGWEVVAAAPEMLQTAYGSLFRALKVQAGDTLLIRGGSTSVGLAAAGLAKARGAKVFSTTRKSTREGLLKEAGADAVVIDSGCIEESIKELLPEGVDKVLELIGTVTLADSLKCVKKGGSVCMAGIVGDSWVLPEGTNPMELIPSCVNLTTYAGDTADFLNTPLDELLQQVERGELKLQIGKVFKLDQMAEVHRVMEENSAGGKIVVLN
ncbi:GroES-like protein [Saccharata proteae CBS 121410]|uniref:GroES-like protein n=1 Tax=Saccharata proteae CBS 121410 TaxID=1314787 RepID=A0A9P4HLR4_9PEZI|nr:GroES-like protein [Saccharata proteae CBS 121410]